MCVFVLKSRVFCVFFVIFGDFRLNFLKRRIRLTPSGVELEGDDNHVQGLMTEWDMKECTPVSTPYVKPQSQDLLSEGRLPMSPKDATLFRRAAARINYVALIGRT